MPFLEHYDPETLALMTRVLDETWQAVLSKSVFNLVGSFLAFFRDNEATRPSVRVSVHA
jgi:hypothetical protein